MFFLSYKKYLKERSQAKFSICTMSMLIWPGKTLGPSYSLGKTLGPNVQTLQECQTINPQKVVNKSFL